MKPTKGAPMKAMSNFSSIPFLLRQSAQGSLAKVVIPEKTEYAVTANVGESRSIIVGAYIWTLTVIVWDPSLIGIFHVAHRHLFLMMIMTGRGQDDAEKRSDCEKALHDGGVQEGFRPACVF
jgi:hypothetical protein